MGWFGWRRRRGARDDSASGDAGRRGFSWLGGRRRLATMPYLLPSDDREVQRLDFQHFMLRYALRGNYLAPIHDPVGILDVGCGTGRWAMELAAQYPAANVIGVDATPPAVDQQASLGFGLDRRPDNYVYIQGDVIAGLPFADATFDFVHQRLLTAAIPEARWPSVVAELARVTRPGGWIELVEGQGTMANMPPRSAMAQLENWAGEACARRGLDAQVATKLQALLGAAGLADVAMRRFLLPVGRQGGRLGQMVEADTLAFFGAIGGLVAATGVADMDAYDRTLQAMKAEIGHSRYAWPVFVAYGRRTT